MHMYILISVVCDESWIFKNAHVSGILRFKSNFQRILLLSSKLAVSIPKQNHRTMNVWSSKYIFWNSNCGFVQSMALIYWIYGINLLKSDIAHCLLRAQPVHITNDQQAQVSWLHTLCLAKSNYFTIETSNLMTLTTQLIALLLVMQSCNF